MYSLTYVLISTMVFGKFSLYVKKLSARKACSRTRGSVAGFRRINRCNDIVSERSRF